MQHAALAGAKAEAAVLEAVETARADGLTWTAIGSILGPSDEAARQRYGKSAKAS